MAEPDRMIVGLGGTDKIEVITGSESMLWHPLALVTFTVKETAVETVRD